MLDMNCNGSLAVLIETSGECGGGIHSCPMLTLIMHSAIAG